MWKGAKPNHDFHNGWVCRVVCYDLQYQMLFSNQEKWHKCIFQSHLDVVNGYDVGLKARNVEILERKSNWWFVIISLVSRKLTKFLCISFSKIFETCNKIDNGLWSIIRSDIFSTRLKTGITLGSFNLLGKTPFWTQWLIYLLNKWSFYSVSLIWQEHHKGQQTLYHRVNWDVSIFLLDKLEL